MITRLVRWLVQTLGVKPLLYFCLLLLGVGSAAYGLSDIVNGLEPEFTAKVVLIAIASSWFLARTRLNTWVGVFTLITMGVVMLVIMIGNLWGPIIALINSIDYFIWAYLHPEPNIPIDLNNLDMAYLEVLNGIELTFGALWDWLLSIQDGLPVQDEIAIGLGWGLITWVMACWAGWVLKRYHQPLLSILPAGTVLSVSASYSWAGTGAFLPLIFATLLLLALENYDYSESGWLKSKMDYPEDLPRGFSITATALVVGIVALAALLPIVSIDNILEFAQKFSTPKIQAVEPLIQSFGLNQSSFPSEDVRKATHGGFPRRHLMGSGPELAENIVMTVQLTGGIDGGSSANIDLPLYWRSLTYDDYFGVGWRSSDIILRSYKPGEEVIVSDSAYHQILQLDFRIAQGESEYLYAPGEILSADDAFEIAYRPTVRFTEVLSAHGDFFGASIDNNSYRVQSAIPIVTEEDLRKTSIDYPEWIKERYLQLPESVPSRVLKLAEDLTYGKSNPYDQARSLERYLRGFEYNLDVDLPPLGQDMVDYFLFDLQYGYCDYFASSMIVMARSLGLPSRLAIGYYRGNYDEINQRYIVTEADAHSWVEVYFPDIGWVPFEPTAGRDDIDPLIPILEDIEGINKIKKLRPLTPWYLVFRDMEFNSLWYILAGIPIIFLFSFMIDEFRIRRMRPTKSITFIYQRLFRLGSRVRARAMRETTPWQFARMLIDRMEHIVQYGYFKRYISSSINEIENLTKLYTRTIYGPRKPDIDDQMRALTSWRRIRIRFWLAVIVQWITGAAKGRIN